MADATSTKRERAPRTLKQRAVALLARREYSRAELRKRLAPTGAHRDDVDAVLDELCATGLLSDARYAAAIVRQKSDNRSRRAIGHALREKGVGADEASAALEALDGQDELAAAQMLWMRRYGNPPRDVREKARQVRFLLSRGYSQSIVFKVLKAAGPPVEEDE